MKKQKKWDEAQQRFIKTRARLTPEQLAELKKEFKKKPFWDEDDKFRIGKKLGLEPVKVGKWNWDERKKQGIPTERKH